MVDPKQIPHLMKLIDDESLNVRATVARQLTAFGPALTDELKKMNITLNGVQKGYITEILKGHKRIWLQKAWPKWIGSQTQEKDFVLEYERLEAALSILSEFLNEMDCDVRLSELLDVLAGEYKAKFKEPHPVRLAKFLFKEKKICGNEKDYYNFQNSNLIHVVREKKGIPISLAAVYMLVGFRLGLKIEGCHFPGHFLARIHLGGKEVFVDCFNEGHVISKKDLLNIKEETLQGMEKILDEKTNTQMIVCAFLANLIRAYQIGEDKENSELLIRLFSDMDLYTNNKKISELTPNEIINRVRAIFEPGQRVCHARYGYRGIVVDVDQACTATNDWYYGNQTQPSRHQPWYHILVHGSDQVTYVAENNLHKDDSNQKVIHPLLPYFFTKTKEGCYIRNDNIWPETDF